MLIVTMGQSGRDNVFIITFVNGHMRFECKNMINRIVCPIILFSWMLAGCSTMSSKFLQSCRPNTTENPGLFESVFGLRLPSDPVSRRIVTCRPISAGERADYAVIEGAGCIRRLQISLDYKKQQINRNLIIRIYFDGEETPFVEAPYGDFFGAMNNLHYYRVNTPFLSIQRWNTYTCYFPMPFARGARIELEANQDTPVFLHVDWHAYPRQDFSEKRRFCARWRREMPAQAHGEDYLLLDADGPGQFVGFFYAINLLKTRMEARWSHGGADNLYIDGQGQFPSYLRGIGGEEVFGTGWGGGEYPPDSHLYNDMPYYVMEKGLPRERPTVDEYGHELLLAEGDQQQMVGYRFYLSDTVHFQESIQVRFGCKDHDISSTAYWYAQLPPRAFFEMPPWEQIQPGVELKRGQFDKFVSSGRWELVAPLPMEVLDTAFPIDCDYDPGREHGYEWLIQNYPAREIVKEGALLKKPQWVERNAFHGFIDFNHVFRPPLGNSNTPTFPGVGLARTGLFVEKETKVAICISWTDRMVLQLNNNPPLDLGDHYNFESQIIEMELKAGWNRILLKNSNRGNPFGYPRSAKQFDYGSDNGGWAFAFTVRTPNGQIIMPQRWCEPKESKTP